MEEKVGKADSGIQGFPPPSNKGLRSVATFTVHSTSRTHGLLLNGELSIYPGLEGDKTSVVPTGTHHFAQGWAPL